MPDIQRDVDPAIPRPIETFPKDEIVPRVVTVINDRVGTL
jgi:hypothetical protein